jgi:Mg-chelatase subunit ChlD
LFWAVLSGLAAPPDPTAVESGVFSAFPSAALTCKADVLFATDFEAGDEGWLVIVESGTVAWWLIRHPHTVRVLTPAISPALVELPDAGYLPRAHSGEACFWFGSDVLSPGTFIGEYVPELQAPLGGGTSLGEQEAMLLSPPIDLAGQSTVALHFWTWWETEGVDVAEGGFDQMQLYAVTAGKDAVYLGCINPRDDGEGEAFRPYSSGGPGRAGVWMPVTADLSAFAGQTIRVGFRFDSEDNLYNGFRGWLIDDVEVAAGPLPGPSLIATVPAAGVEGDVVQTTGANFVVGAVVALDHVQVPAAVVSAGLLLFEVPDFLAAGWYDVSVTNPDGQSTTLADGFEILGAAPPAVIEVVPSSGAAHASIPLEILGTGFLPGAQVQIGGWTATGVAVVDSERIACFAPSGLAPGFHTVTVTNPDGLSDTLSGGYETTLVGGCDGLPWSFVHLLDVQVHGQSAFPEVMARVLVNTPAGRECLLGLHDVAVSEGGEHQVLTSLDCARRVGAKADIAFVVDGLGCLDAQIGSLRAKAAQFALDLANAGVDARFALLSFAGRGEIAIDLPLSGSAANFAAQVGTLVARCDEGMPRAALDAVWLAAKELHWRPDAQPLLVLITDAPTHHAADGSGLADRGLAETVALVESIGGAVFALGPALGSARTLPRGADALLKADADPGDVRALARATGGHWQDLGSVEFGAWLDWLGEAIASIHTVTYASSNPVPDGTWREVMVTVTDPWGGVLKDGAPTPITDCDVDGYRAPQAGLECPADDASVLRLMALGCALPERFPEVQTTVRVDTAAGSACGLTAEHFALAEDGVWQTVVSATCAGASGSAADIVLCLDTAEGMGDQLAAVKAQASRFANLLFGFGVDARFALVSFYDEEAIELDFTADPAVLQAAVDGLVAAGGGDTPDTAFDAALLGLTDLDWREGALRLLLVITDSPSHYRGDGTPFAVATLDEVTAACQASGASVFALAPPLARGTPSRSGSALAFTTERKIFARPDDVRALADGTGGIWRETTAMDAGAFLEEAAFVIPSLYTVVYSSRNRLPDGARRHVVLQVDDPGAGILCDASSYRAPAAPLECDGPQGHGGLYVMGLRHVQDGIFPQVTASLRVDSHAGRNGTLTRADFALSEDGAVQRLTAVTCTLTAGSVADLAFCVDVSGSMGATIAAFRARATSLVQALAAAGVDARLALVSFRDDAALALDFTADPAVFQAAVDGLTADGGGDTPEVSLDGVMLALSPALAWRAGAHRLVVVLTDAPSHYRGDGTASAAHTVDETLAAATAAGAAVCALAPDLNRKGVLVAGSTVPGRHKTDSTRPDDVRVVAEASGGLWRDIGDTTAETFADELVEVMASLYTLTYTTANARRDGTWRQAVIGVTDPELGSACGSGWYQAPLECFDLSVAPAGIEAACLTGTSPVPALFRVANACVGRLEYSLAEEIPWLAIVPGSGASDRDWNEHRIEFDTAWLPPGSYQGSVLVSGAGQTQALNVRLTVTDLLVSRSLPTDCRGPGDLLDVSVALASFEPPAATALALAETLPDGWSFVGLVSGVPLPTVQAGADPREVEFAWADPPVLPYTLVYRVQASSDGTDPPAYGKHCFSGRASRSTAWDEVWTDVYGADCTELSDCGTTCPAHQADQNGNWVIDTTPELTRLIQFYNLRGYHSQAGTEDGYAPAVGATFGGPHQADQNRDWVLQLTPELTRLIQLHNSGGYHCAVGTEDGYAPATAARKPGATKGTLTSLRSVGSVPYQAGSTLDISVTLTHSDPSALSSLAVEETLPVGWAFQSVLSAPLPAARPTAGATGTLGFAWVAIPAGWPLTLTYRVSIPPGTVGAQTLFGSASFREDAGETTVPTPASSIEGRDATVALVVAGNGSLAGTLVQTIPVGASTTPVTAVPAASHLFAGWLREGTPYSSANPLVVENVQTDMVLLAVFVADTRTVTFVASMGGSIVGTPTQAVIVGGSTEMVSARARFGFVFSQWDDAVTTPERTIVNVTTDQTLTARFRPADPVAPPDGAYDAVVDTEAVALGRGWWDLSGVYAGTVEGKPLVLNLLHDSRGRLGGSATYTVAKDTPVVLSVRGSVKGTAGGLVARLSLKGTDAGGTMAVALALNLTLDADRRHLVGPLAGSVTIGGARTPLVSAVNWPIPAPMDGTWTLALLLAPAGSGVTGSARLLLSHGVVHDDAVKGKVVGQAAVLRLAGVVATAAGGRIRIETTVTPLEGGWARLDSFRGRGYGQTVAW